MVRSQVRRGRPGRRLQSLGNPRVDVYRALDVSCESPIRATCPKKRFLQVRENWTKSANLNGQGKSGENIFWESQGKVGKMKLVPRDVSFSG